MTGCSLIGGESSADSGEQGGQVVRVVTHDSFTISEDLLEEFEQDTGYTLEFSAPGDAGALVNQLVLTKDSPLGDVVYGVDNTFAGRAIAEDVFEPYTSPELPDSAEEYRTKAEGTLTPIDVGDVCLNVDHQYFTEHDLPEPQDFEDLLDPEYKDMTVVTNPATSSPGLAFMMATVDAFGQDGWLDYWQQLGENGLKVEPSWSDAYSVDFSGSTGNGDRPIVLSYSTSPAFEVTEDQEEAPTGALLDTCFRQVEYAGVLAGADNPEGAEAFIDFLLSEGVQADIPQQMFMYPVNDEVELPQSWTNYAPLSQDPYSLDVQTINEHREEWIEAWTETVVG
ncbi:MAG TPA: thiamine ABC transporter substrate-binding protein [Ruania sp.]|nr:thiamine ABC transporter substrate-binding protein [Ruania sp.]